MKQSCFQKGMIIFLFIIILIFLYKDAQSNSGDRFEIVFRDHAGQLIPESGQQPGITIFFRDRVSGTEEQILAKERIREAVLTKNQLFLALLIEEDTLWIMDTQKRSTFQVDQNVTGDLAWSPDGFILAYTKRIQPDKPEVRHLYLFDLIVRKSRIFVKGMDVSRPVWSPDGATIFFVASFNGIPSIWKGDVYNNTIKQLTNMNLHRKGGKIPDGFIPVPVSSTKAVVTEKFVKGEVWFLFDTGDGVWGIRSDGTKSRRLSESEALDFLPNN